MKDVFKYDLAIAGYVGKGSCCQTTLQKDCGSNNKVRYSGR